MSDSEPTNDPTASTSTWDDSRITAYVMGELSAQERTVFEDALASDPELRSAVDQAGSVTDQLHDLFASESPNKLDSDRRDSILAASKKLTRTIQLTPTDGSSSQTRWVPWLLAAAATLLLAFGLLPAFQRSRISQMQPESTITNDIPERFDSEIALSGELMEMPKDESLLRRLDRDEAESPTPETILSVRAEYKAPAMPLADQSELEEAAEKGTMQILNEFPARTGRIMFGGAVNSDAGSLAEKPQITAEPKVIYGSDRDESTPVVGDFAVANVPGKSVKRKLAQTPAAPTSSQSLVEKAAAPTAAPTLASGRQLQIAVLPAQERSSYTYETNLSRSSRYKLSLALAKRESGLSAPFATTLGEQIQTRSDGDRFEPITENEFKSVADHPLSTFSIDVDTASYSKVRRTLAEGRLPRPDAVRIEELVNYFGYGYKPPADDAEHPFSAEVTIANCPWNSSHRLARVAIQGKTIDRQSRPPCNLVFLLDTSGSMNRPSKLPLVIEGMKMLTKQLNDDDRVAIVVYAGSAGIVLDSTPATKRKKIKKALNQLSAGGSTNGGAGIQLAYATARDNFIKQGVNRVILCTDGDFNVGMSGTDELVRLIQDEASGGIFLTALGFGMGNHNDAMMEQISGKGNGNYAFIDTANEARKVLVHQTNSTLVTIAKDVKLQLEFNPRIVSQYRLIGYENRMMAKEDFNDDKKDAGEIGAGHQVTALYELVLASKESRPKSGPDDKEADETDSGDSEVPSVDPLKYQQSRKLTPAASGSDVMTIKLRYKQPDGDTSTLVQFTAKDNELEFAKSDADFQFAASVASFGMLLRNSRFAGDWTLSNVHEVAEASLGSDEFELRSEFIDLVRAAQNLRDGR